MALTKYEKPDRLILLGDILYHGPRNDLPKEYAPKKVIEMLNSISDSILCVRGNCDTNSNLNEAEVINIEDVKVGLTHGVVYPRGDTQQLYYIAKELGVDVLISGHTHQPMVEKIDDVILLNPGSPTQPRLTDATVMVVEINGSDIQADIIKIANAMCRSMDVSQLGLNYKKD